MTTSIQSQSHKPVPSNCSVPGCTYEQQAEKTGKTIGIGMCNKCFSTLCEAHWQQHNHAYARKEGSTSTADVAKRTLGT